MACNNKNLIWCFYAFILSMSIILTTIKQVESRPNVEEMTDMVEALRTLERLDKIYSQIARPR